MTISSEDYFEFKWMCELAIRNFLFDFYTKPKNQYVNTSLEDAQSLINRKFIYYFDTRAKRNQVSNLFLEIAQWNNTLGLDETTKFLVFDTNDACVVNPLIINALIEQVSNLSIATLIQSQLPQLSEMSSGVYSIFDLIKGFVEIIEVIETLVEDDKELFSLISKLCLAKTDMFDKAKYIDLHLNYVRNKLGYETLVIPNYNDFVFLTTKLDKDYIFNNLFEFPLAMYVCSRVGFENITYEFINIVSKSMDIDEPNSFIKLRGYGNKFKMELMPYLRTFYKESKFINDINYKKLVFENSQFLLNLQYEDKLKQFIYDLSFSTQNYGI